MQAQIEAMRARAAGDDHRVEVAEESVATCARRLHAAALALDRLCMETGDEDVRRLVEGALRVL